jgi:hypothetical protein
MQQQQDPLDRLGPIERMGLKLCSNAGFDFVGIAHQFDLISVVHRQTRSDGRVSIC